MKYFHVGSHKFGNRSGSCSESCGFRIAQVARRHSENGISHFENYFLREIILQNEFCTRVSAWRYEFRCEFLREFHDKYLRSILAFVERVK